MSYIEFENIWKSFDGKHYVLQGVDLSVEKGSLVTLLGPSGCGKSTLLRCLAGFIPVNQGKMYIDQTDITHFEPGKRNIGMVFQQYSLFPNMNVFENIAFGLKMKKESKMKIQQKVQEIIQMVGLEGREKYYPRSLSGGQKQRVALARAIVTEPQVILLDEPLSAIDAQRRKSLQRSIREIQQRLKITAIFVTHDQDEAMLLSDRILLMNEGKIEQEGDPVSLYTHPATKFAASFIGNYNVLEASEFEKMSGFQVSSAIALRPEAITIHKADYILQNTPDDILLEGVIQSKRARGNILSYRVEIQGVSLKADQLFRSHALFEQGESVKISFEKRNCLTVK